MSDPLMEFVNSGLNLAWAATKVKVAEAKFWYQLRRHGDWRPIAEVEREMRADPEIAKLLEKE